MDERQKKEGVYEGRRVPITKSEFHRLSYLHDGGTFIVQSGVWHNMQERLVDIQCGGPDPSDERGEAKMIRKESE